MRIALGIEYVGTDYFGWQFQSNLPTVQGHLETALSQIADEPIKVFCAGRTDAGVHAKGQVIHFDTNAMRSDRAWVLGTNTHLPHAIAVRWIKYVEDDFHARFSAMARRYQYLIYNHSIRSAHEQGRTTWFYHALDIEKMQQAATYFLGEQDFSSFRSSSCESSSPFRNVHFVTILQRQENIVCIDIQANAFLHHMVRNIAGVLMRIGAGFHSPEWAKELLLAKDRRLAAETASPAGLYLMDVIYPNELHIPSSIVV